ARAALREYWEIFPFSSCMSRTRLAAAESSEMFEMRCPVATCSWSLFMPLVMRWRWLSSESGNVLLVTLMAWEWGRALGQAVDDDVEHLVDGGDELAGGLV